MKETVLNKVDDVKEIKERIFIKLINRETNKEFLKDVPHKDFLDLAEVCYIRFGDSDNPAAAIVTNKILRALGFTEETLFEIAFQNAKNIETTAERIEVVINRHTSLNVQENMLKTFVVSNKEYFLGADRLLFPDAFNKITDNENDGIVILPSSIHEVLAVVGPDVLSDLDEFRNMVKSVNSMLKSDDVLSDTVYVYDRDSNSIYIPGQKSKNDVINTSIEDFLK